MNKKIFLRRLISTVAAAALIGGVFSVLAVINRNTAKNRYRQILERDGFLYGIHYPWFPSSLGHSFSANEIFGYATSGWNIDGEEAIYEDLLNMKALGFNVINIMAGGLRGEGVMYSEIGEITGLSEEFKTNFRSFMNLAKRAGVDLSVTLQMHTTDIYNSLGKEAWDKYTQYYCNATVREQYIRLVVKPILNILKDYEDMLIFLVLGDELENEINDTEMDTNMYGTRGIYGVSFENMYAFYKDMKTACDDVLPDVAVTIGANNDYISRYSDLGLDLMGRNRYSDTASVTPIGNFKTPYDMILFEYGISSVLTVEHYNRNNLSMITQAKEAGYKGALWWSYWPKSSPDPLMNLFKANMENRHDYRDLAYLFHYYILDSLYEKNGGDEEQLDEPAMFYQNGSGEIAWIASRQAETLDIERSYDGGETWKKLVSGVPASDYQEDFSGKYNDTSLTQGKTVCYRVISYDSEGASAASKASNTAKVKEPPKNILEDSGFESGKMGKWKKFGTNASSIKSTEKHEGNYSLNLRGSGWSHVYQDVKVKPNTKYELSFWYKRDPSYPTGSAFIYVRKGAFATDPPKLTEDWIGKTSEWSRFSTSFTTGSNVEYDTISIDFCLNDPPVYFYIDDVVLMEH